MYTERFKVVSYNILADYLAQEHQFLYERIPSFILDWNWRKDKLVFEFGLWSPDILCLQVVCK
jgi:mRNA deadenylase 3'-5' endonuclease subunit Ccr4